MIIHINEDGSATVTKQKTEKAGITSDTHDAIRQIVREEICQLVTRESGRGGLFSK